jgi:hypothetical protein
MILQLILKVAAWSWFSVGLACASVVLASKTSIAMVFIIAGVVSYTAADASSHRDQEGRSRSSRG